jgi:hypothetical protein
MFTTSQILDAKAPSIYAYLLTQGFMPSIDKAHYAMFKSPFRADNTASFKVDKNENMFFDFGTNENGDFIAFYQLANGLNFKEAVTQILANSFSFQCQKPEAPEATAPAMTLHKVKDLENKALLQYLESRKVDIDIAKALCEEVYYYANGKHYFGVGFKNDSGGYEIRNKYFKGCIGEKDITFLNDYDFVPTGVAIFEGFLDFISAISFWIMKGSAFKCHSIVLNSVTNLKKALPHLEGYNKIFAFFDNDRAGQSALQTLRASYTVHDCSKIYYGYKDFSEFMEKADEAY